MWTGPDPGRAGTGHESAPNARILRKMSVRTHCMTKDTIWTGKPQPWPKRSRTRPAIRGPKADPSGPGQTYKTRFPVHIFQLHLTPKSKLKIHYPPDPGRNRPKTYDLLWKMTARTHCRTKDTIKCGPRILAGFGPESATKPSIS